MIKFIPVAMDLQIFVLQDIPWCRMQCQWHLDQCISRKLLELEPAYAYPVHGVPVGFHFETEQLNQSLYCTLEGWFWNEANEKTEIENVQKCSNISDMQKEECKCIIIQHPIQVTQHPLLKRICCLHFQVSNIPHESLTFHHLRFNNLLT